MKILIILLILASCSPNIQKQQITTNENEVINLSSQTVDASLIDNQVSLPNIFIDLSDVSKGQKTISSIFIKNTHSQAISFNNLDFVFSDLAPVQVISGCLSVSLPRNRTCKIEFSLENDGSNAQTETINKIINIKMHQLMFREHYLVQAIMVKILFLAQIT